MHSIFSKIILAALAGVACGYVIRNSITFARQLWLIHAGQRADRILIALDAAVIFAQVALVAVATYLMVTQ